jgi:hypothetical protein
MTSRSPRSAPAVECRSRWTSFRSGTSCAVREVRVVAPVDPRTASFITKGNETTTLLARRRVGLAAAAEAASTGRISCPICSRIRVSTAARQTLLFCSSIIVTARRRSMPWEGWSTGRTGAACSPRLRSAMCGARTATAFARRSMAVGRNGFASRPNGFASQPKMVRARICGCVVVVAKDLPKIQARVRFPPPALGMCDNKIRTVAKATRSRRETRDY